MVDSQKILSEIRIEAHRLHQGLNSMGCVVTRQDTTPPEISDWAFADGRVINTPRESDAPPEFPVSFYWDGKKNYNIQRGKWRGKDLDYAAVDGGTRDTEQWTPLAFAYRMNRSTWLDEVLSDPHASLIDVSKDSRLGVLYRIRVRVPLYGGEELILTLAKAYNYAIIRSEVNIRGFLQVYECSDFTKINGYWVPQSASMSGGKENETKVHRMLWWQFSNIRVNTVPSSETKWIYPVGSHIYDDQTRIKSTLNASGKWEGVYIPPLKPISQTSSPRNPKSLYTWLLAIGMGSLFITWFIRSRYFSESK